MVLVLPDVLTALKLSKTWFHKQLWKENAYVGRDQFLHVGGKHSSISKLVVSKSLWVKV